MKVVLHRLLAFSWRSLFAHGSAPPLGWAARPLAASEPIVVGAQMLHASVLAPLNHSSRAIVFKAKASVLPRLGQQASLVFLNHVRPTLPSSGQPRGTGFAAQGER
jgi:hypothetical protein